MKLFSILQSRMSVNITEICENTKMGREYALLGNYDTSLIYYQGVLQQIHKLLATIKEPNRKQKWQQASGMLSQLGHQKVSMTKKSYSCDYIVLVQLLSS